MASATIDHIMAVTVLLVAVVLTIGLYAQALAVAMDYERNRQVVVKASELIDTICLSPGSPVDWGETNATVLGFGLQNPESTGYTLSPYSMMKLTAAQESQLVYYYRTGMYYSNSSLNPGSFLLMPVDTCIDYSTAARLLGVNGTYGFQLTVAPTLAVTVSQVPASYLILNVEVRGPGSFLGGATLNYYLHQTVKGAGTEPEIVSHLGVAQTDATGSVQIEFPSVDDTDDAYTFVAYAHFSGLNGVGYCAHDVLDGYPQFIVPFVHDYEKRKVMLVHSWDVHNYTETPVPSVRYSATFYSLTEDYEFRQEPIVNSTGLLTYGVGKPYATTQLPTSWGILFISYRWGNRLGTVMMPWGIHTLGVTVTFGDTPTDIPFIATELRQVLVRRMAYQVKLAVWSLEN